MGGLGLVAIWGAATSGAGGLLSMSGCYLLVVSSVALVRGRVEWARLRSRAAGAVALGVSMALTAMGGATADPQKVAPRKSEAKAAALHPTRTPSTASASPDAPSSALTSEGTALSFVATLVVKGRASKTGFSRDQFGQAWFDADRNGCDTRNDTLRRDLVDTTMKNWCKVLSGTLASDPYTGKPVSFVIGGGSEIDVDHVVALSDAWQKGAATWPVGKRLAFANDPLNVLAVAAGPNRAKGGGDVASWLPPAESTRCAYVARVVAVKVKYQVWVTAAERDAILNVLSACATPPTLPAPGPAPTIAPLPKSAVTVVPQPTSAAPLLAPSSPSRVNYENCAAVLAAGANPIRKGQPGYGRHLDGDGDGVACER